MKTYKIIFTETLVHTFKVEGNSPEEAEAIFEMQRSNGELDFSDGEILDTETQVVEVNARLRRIGYHGFSCVVCGKMLQPNDMVSHCSDCGATFCEKCVKSGALARHDCEEDEDT